MKSVAKSMWGHLGKAGLASLLALVALAALASPSTAATGAARYVYEVCDPALPGGNSPGVNFVGNPPAMSGNNLCDQPGGNLGIYQASEFVKDVSRGGEWTVPVGAPRGGSIESLTLSAASCSVSQFSEIYVYEEGWPATCAGESQRTFRPPPGTASLSIPIYLGCEANCPGWAYVYARYFAATEVDPVPPAVSAVQGPLLSSGVARGRAALSAEATDQGGGLSEIKVLVNGQLAATNTQPCAVVQTTNPSTAGFVAASVSPCPATVKSSWTLNTATYPFHDGANFVQVCASDFATIGVPNSSCSSPQTAVVDNSCTESPVVGGEALSAQFIGSHEEDITVPFDHSATLRGTLTSNAGAAIVGATICVQTQTLGSPSDPVAIETTTTDAQGHFTYKVTPGPNRRVLVGYRHDSFQLARSMRYYAHAKPTLRLRPNRVQSGDRIGITGKVPGPNAADRVVVLQASALHSPRWFTFHRATANANGVFHSSYRFDATTQTTTYRIRAVIPRQGGYPWAVGHSRPALVEVRVGAERPSHRARP